MPTPKNTAIYLRSSKDRHDTSPAAQRRMLQELALVRGMTIVAEFSDAVESGKDENRPGFQRLLRSIRNQKRGWSTLLVLDTARIARRRHISILFEEMECRRRGVDVVYRSLPEADPITTMLLKSVLQAMDEWHSLTSKDKGLAGMRENVRGGFRAGGRAPRGYKLVHMPTGAVRDGAPVTKSKLEPDPVTAPIVAAFLKARAAGEPRMSAARRSGLKMSGSSLVGVEWNALTYAGNTVWNVHAERKDGGYVGGSKRRPRNEWVIHKDTHEALIDADEAETILARLERYSQTHKRRRGSRYLLSGILVTPKGERWTGDSGRYRLQAGRKVPAEQIESAVVKHILSDLQSPKFVRALTRAAKASMADNEQQDRARAIRDELAQVTSRIGKLVDVAAEAPSAAPYLRKVDQLEEERNRLASALAEAEATRQTMFHEISEHEVRGLLVGLADEIGSTDRDGLKQALFTLLDHIELDPESMDCTVHYRLSPGISSNPLGDATLTPAESTMPRVVNWK